jgi:hypothetical protein
MGRRWPGTTVGGCLSLNSRKRPSTSYDRVVDFMRQQYWLVYDPEERRRMLVALAAVSQQSQPEPATDAT